MTTIEILKKDLPECIWKRMIKYPLRAIDPAYYYRHELLDLISWSNTSEGRGFWSELYWLYFDYTADKPQDQAIERVYRKHGIPLEVPSGEA